MNITEIFGSNVFNESVMRERLPKKVFAEVMDVMAHGGQISMTTADIVANEMKDWAVEKGATHYTHWFQPLTGTTAEKHDSFITLPVNGKTLLQLTGKQLIMGEPDASSFPSGGLRDTAYARGYTAWDITSPAFVKEMSAGNVLCIPTIFVSYSGEALDTKLPLLRSMEAISEQSLRILRLFGNTTARRVYPNVGPEQEYFLVDRNKYLTRRDLIYCGRTLFGAPAPKGQELDDQYFGVIRERVGAFMKDLNNELWKLGITATTQHNEVAPAQHEMAPIFSVCNVAVDQNQLTMETMKRVATRHGLVCLLHEKPYAGVNGSGKHNNWSISTDTGENLMEPGDDPKSNLQFQLVLACILKAVDVHAALLRQSASNVGNDLRLGAQEAPPAIISIFLGDQLDEMVHNIVNGTEEYGAGHNALDSGVSTVPVLMRDATDRNRTSPFAFTGNKFEFRMVGSSNSIACANIMLNSAVAQVLQDFADELEAAPDFDEALRKLIRATILDHKRIIFNGNGYDDAWIEEATQVRGLENLRTTADALPRLLDPKNREMLTAQRVFTEAELHSRYEIQLENYCKTVRIEAVTMVEMARRRILPAVSRAAAGMAADAQTKRALSPELACGYENRRVALLSGLTDRIDAQADALAARIERLDALSDIGAEADFIRDEILPAMDALRAPCDEAEGYVAKADWPFPTYGDLLFSVR